MSMSASTVDPTEMHSTTGGLASNAINAASDKVNEKMAATQEKAAEIKEAKRIAEEMAADDCYPEEIHAELEQRLSLQGAVITVVVAGATAYAGINVMSSIAETMALTSGDMFYNSSQDLEKGINDFFTNMPTVFVVIALVLIIGYLTLLRS